MTAARADANKVLDPFRTALARFDRNWCGAAERVRVVGRVARRTQVGILARCASASKVADAARRAGV